MAKIMKSFLPGLGFLFVVGISLSLAMSIFVSQANADTNILADRDLTVGSTGGNVVVLQGLLSEMGYLAVPAGVPLGYFGPLTRSAVARYQAAHSVYPAVGYFGPLTKVAMHGQFASQGWLAMLGW